MSGIINSAGSKSGIVDLYGSNRPHFHVRRFDNVTSPDAIVFTGSTEVLIDTGNFINLTTGYCYPPISGRYFFTAGFITNTASLRHEMEIRKNNVNLVSVNESTDTTTLYGGGSCSVIVDLVTTDHIRLHLGIGAILSDHAACTFGGYYFGPST